MRRAFNNRGGLFSGRRMHGLCLDPRLNGPYCSRTSTRFASTSFARACPGAMLMSSITSRVSAFETLRSHPRSEVAITSSWLPSTRTTSQYKPFARKSRAHTGRTTRVSPGWRAKRLLNEARSSPAAAELYLPWCEGGLLGPIVSGVRQIYHGARQIHPVKHVGLNGWIGQPAHELKRPLSPAVSQWAGVHGAKGERTTLR